jgi:hypothetical protein
MGKVFGAASGRRLDYREICAILLARSAAVPKTPAEPTNLVLEQLRLIRSEMNLIRTEMKDGFNKVDERFSQVDSEIAGLKREIRGFKLGTIAEIYKANLTVASFVDLESRVSALESKAN